MTSPSMDKLLVPTRASLFLSLWALALTGLSSQRGGGRDAWSPYDSHLQVKKIHENEKRLEAGDHPVELLARDFEKNYNMYIFPVHWQFGQLDQHPSDG